MSVHLQKNCTKVSLVLLFMLFFQFTRAQYDFSEADRRVEQAKKELDGNAVVLVQKDGKIIYQKILGELNAKAQVPVAASSNWLTAALVMTYVDEGKLSLDDKISKYLPVYSKYSKGYITIRHCLAHLTGIDSDPIRSQKSFLDRKKYATLDEEVADFASSREIASNPGLEFRYSQVGPDIAARILEIITRRSFEQLMQERITRPLMMRNTSFSSFSAVNPTAGAISSAGDYINFLSMILNKGTFNGKRILSEKAIAEMETAQTTPAMIKYAPKAVTGFNYGMGAWIQETDENGKATILSAPGLFGTWPLVDKCRGYALIVLTKGTLSEEKKELVMGIKDAIDAVIPSACR